MTNRKPANMGGVAEPYNLKVSFQVGLRQHFMVLVFCLLSLRGSGISFSFT